MIPMAGLFAQDAIALLMAPDPATARPLAQAADALNRERRDEDQRTLDEALAYINGHERPLALYLFSNDRQVRETVLSRTMSGGVSINDCAMHVAQHDMPFGGIGNSGMGQYHGYEGFAEFSKLRPLFPQGARPLGASFLYPPYGKAFATMYKLLIKMRWV